MANNFKAFDFGIRITGLAADPLTGKLGEIYFNTLTKAFRKWDGTQWVDIAGNIVELSNQDRSFAVIKGGVKVFSGSTLSWSEDAYVQVAGVASNRNTISAGSVILSSDGQVAYVSVNRSGVGAAVLTPVVADIATVPFDSVTGINIVIFARRVDGDIIWGSEGSSSAQDGVYIQQTLLNNATNIVFSKSVALSDGYILHYSLNRNNIIEIGTLYVATDGTNVAVAANGSDVGGAIGLTFGGIINTGMLELQGIVDNSGNDVVMRYRWEKFKTV